MMELWQVFNDPNNFVFAVCLMVCGAIVLLEVLGLLIGFTNDWIDNLVPDVLKVDVDINTEGAGSFLVAFSSWLYLGRLPFLIWLIIFFGGFGVIGIVLQLNVEEYFGNPLIPLIAIPIAFVINLFVTHFVCRIVNPIIPKDETTAIELKELIGLTAEIVVGTAKPNYPAQAKVKDQHGTLHYIMVTPVMETEYKQGDQVIVYEYQDEKFTVISSSDLNQLSNNIKGNVE